MVAGSKKITPEEKLLHLIENSHGLNRLSPEKDISERKKFINAKSISFSNFIPKINLHTINKTLIGISVILALIFLVYWNNEKAQIQKGFGVLQKQKTEEEIPRLDLQQHGAPDTTTSLATTTETLPAVKEPEVIDAPLASEFKLVGILWADKAQAIIEDNTAGQTYLVSEGDMIDIYTVTKISQTEVKLNSKDGEKILQ